MDVYRWWELIEWYAAGGVSGGDGVGDLVLAEAGEDLVLYLGIKLGRFLHKGRRM